MTPYILAPQAEAELKARELQKEMTKSINQLKQLATELDTEEELRAAKALRKQVKACKGAFRTRPHPTDHCAQC